LLSRSDATQWKALIGVSSAIEAQTGSSVQHEVHKSGISHVIYHLDWNERTFRGDIALFELKDPVPNWSEFIQPSCIYLPSMAQMEGPRIEPGMEVEVIGMGAIAEGSWKTSDYLEYTAVAIMKNKDCNRYFGSNLTQDDMICAGRVQDRIISSIIFVSLFT